jgi:hypothetical protein
MPKKRMRMINPMKRLLLGMLLLAVVWFAHGWLRGQDFPATAGKEVPRDELVRMNDQ